MPSNAVLESGFGSVLIILYTSLILGGLVMYMAYNYFYRYPQERPTIKALVAALLLVDIFSIICACGWEYHLLVENWGNTDVLKTIHWTFALSPFNCGLMAFMVQSFFAWRIKVITKNLYLTGLVAFLGLCAFIGGTATSIAVLELQLFDRFEEIRAYPQIWLFASSIGDLIITGSLTWYLRKGKGQGDDVDRVIDRVVRITVQNGLLTSLATITDLLLFSIAHSPDHTVSFWLPHLYAISVLSSLNARNPNRAAAWYSVASSNINKLSKFQDTPVFNGKATPAEMTLVETATASQFIAGRAGPFLNPSVNVTFIQSETSDMRTPTTRSATPSSTLPLLHSSASTSTSRSATPAFHSPGGMIAPPSRAVTPSGSVVYSSSLQRPIDAEWGPRPQESARAKRPSRPDGLSVDSIYQQFEMVSIPVAPVRKPLPDWAKGYQRALSERDQLEQRV